MNIIKEIDLRVKLASDFLLQKEENKRLPYNFRKNGTSIDLCPLKEHIDAVYTLSKMNLVCSNFEKLVAHVVSRIFERDNILFTIDDNGESHTISNAMAALLFFKIGDKKKALGLCRCIEKCMKGYLLARYTYDSDDLSLVTPPAGYGRVIIAFLLAHEASKDKKFLDYAIQLATAMKKLKGNFDHWSVLSLRKVSTLNSSPDDDRESTIKYAKQGIKHFIEMGEKDLTINVASIFQQTYIAYVDLLELFGNHDEKDLQEKCKNIFELQKSLQIMDESSLKGAFVKNRSIREARIDFVTQTIDAMLDYRHFLNRRISLTLPKI